MQTPSNPLSREQLVRIAVRQRRVIMVYLAYILASVFLAVFLEVFPLELTAKSLILVKTVDVACRLVAFFFVAWNGVIWARDVEGDKALPYQVGFCIPCLNLVSLLLVSSHSNKILKDHGVKVGFLGASPSDIP